MTVSGTPYLCAALIAALSQAAADCPGRKAITGVAIIPKKNTSKRPVATGFRALDILWSRMNILFCHAIAGGLINRNPVHAL
ncbi:hypothetical protein M3P21_14865 [Ruegeria sp. 2012CJ41-6]|uniref:Secreted protein n=1 Tax=Ruegeria spongiae TaxID=2942209 RepID=A0ABT0Q4N3_9RHOB|nr:hypothetical protein [Ruegeria spongiae]MCL6284813.1 hypothetical protein [Ruegeria spongiae]